jgi:glycosyltransferase involved in cell wall biosynthesis
MKVKYTGPARDYSGYGEANRHDIGALVAAGIDVTTQIPSYTLEIADFGKLGELATSLENKPLGYKIKILHTTPNVYRQFMEGDKYHIGRVFWETDKIPQDFAANVELMDEIWTGSKHNAQAIRNAGVTKPIHIIPEAIDTDIPQKIDPYKIHELPDNLKYTFYSIFEWTERKNPTALLEAYWKAFEGVTDVALVLKTYVDNFTPDKKNEIDNEIRSIKRRLNLTHYAPVFLYRGLMDRHQVYRFHKSFDCFVSAHRGEGWGIPQMEALLLGNPIISTGCGGIHEYLVNNIHGKLIPYQMVPLRENSRNKQWYTQDQQWAEIDQEELGKAMLFAYQNKAEMQEMGERGQRLVKEVFNLKAVGDLMRKRLQEIINEPYEDVKHPEPEQQVVVDGPLLDSEPEGIPQQVGEINNYGVHPSMIVEPERLIEHKDANGKIIGRTTIPPTVRKHKITFDPNARVTEPRRMRVSRE